MFRPELVSIRAGVFSCPESDTRSRALDADRSDAHLYRKILDNVQRASHSRGMTGDGDHNPADGDFHHILSSNEVEAAAALQFKRMDLWIGAYTAAIRKGSDGRNAAGKASFGLELFDKEFGLGGEG